LAPPPAIDRAAADPSDYSYKWRRQVA